MYALRNLWANEREEDIHSLDDAPMARERLTNGRH